METQQTKVNMEIKISKNYNTVTLGLLDEPLPSVTDEEFRKSIRNKFIILREEAEMQLSLIGKPTKSPNSSI